MSDAAKHIQIPAGWQQHMTRVFRRKLIGLCVVVPVLLFGWLWYVFRANAQTRDVTAPASVSCPGEKASALKLSAEEQAWLREHPVVRVALDPAWPPIEFKDARGAVAGISADYMRLVEQRLGVTFEWDLGLSWNESYQQLKAWKRDLATCLSETEERRAFLSFTKPYLVSPIVVLTHVGVSNIGNLRELAGKRIAVVDGHAAGEWIARDYPEIERVKVASTQEGIDRLGHHEVFAFVDNMLVLSYFLAKVNRSDLKISGTSPYVYAQSMAVRKDWGILADILQKALDSISEEDRAALYQKWVPVRLSPAFDYPLFWKMVAIFVLMLGGLLAWNHKLSFEIKKRKRAETALKESEENYRRLFEEHAAVKLIVDPATGAILAANQAAAAFYGWPREAFTRMNIRQISALSPDDLGREMKKVLDKHEYHFEFQHLLADGTIRDVEIFSSPIRWKDGYYLHLIVHDVTERKSAEAERERLIAAIEQAAEGVVIAGVDGGIRFVNPAMETITGLRRSELVGQNVDVLKSEGENGAFNRNLWDILSGGKRWKGRFVIKHKDGTRHVVEATISPVLDAAGKIVNYVSVEHDITDHVRMSEQLQLAQKMESVGRLAGGVAHDFNNMLQIILGHVELAIESVGPEAPVLHDLKEIQKATRNSADLTRQLLAFARKQTIAPLVLDLNETLSGMQTMIQKLIGEDIDLSWRPKSGLWRVNVDPSQVKQILVNLCLNARDAIQGVGKITIETDNVVFDPAYCARHVGVSSGDFVMVAVSDNGCGISAEEQKHLFEPFFTTKKMGQGAGLGLATVYGIVKQNNGTVNVYSEPGQGSVFKIYLPRYVGETAVAPKESMASPERGKGELLLVVEDEVVILTMVRKTLEKLGYRVLTAETPSLALTLAATHAGEIRLLVSDVVMPEMNGRELAKQIQSRDPNVRVLFMSGYTANVIAHHGVLDAGVHFIQKPFTTADLAKKVRTALDQAEPPQSV